MIVSDNSLTGLMWLRRMITGPIHISV